MMTLTIDLPDVVFSSLRRTPGIAGVSPAFFSHNKRESTTLLRGRPQSQGKSYSCWLNAIALQELGDLHRWT
ncbi:MAG: hypothetical protein HQL87_03515 [Magnetococcales bacterium]|nr:hypothetical protein [Magnetococcales bacterium]